MGKHVHGKTNNNIPSNKLFKSPVNCGKYYKGCPASSARLVAGLIYLQHTFNCSDEILIERWVENPYWQYFCGETYLKHEAPVDPSSLSRWRRRMGEEGVEWLLTATIEAAGKAQVVKPSSVEKLIVDTTVMEKAITFPTDGKLLECARRRLVRLARRNGFELRQNYNRVAPRLAIQVGRYAHARQHKHTKSSLKQLRALVGRVWRDVGRHVQDLSDDKHVEALKELLLVGRLPEQKKMTGISSTVCTRRKWNVSARAKPDSVTSLGSGSRWPVPFGKGWLWAYAPCLETRMTGTRWKRLSSRLRF